MKFLFVRSSCLRVFLFLLCAPAGVDAHEGDHSCQPHMVTAGITPLHVATLRGAHPSVGAIDATTIGVPPV